MRFERCRQLRPFGAFDRDEILDRQRVEHLAAEALGDETGADALARRVNRRRRAGRAAADDEYVENLFGADLGGGARRGARIELGDDFLDAHAPLTEMRAIQEHHRHGHDLKRFDFLLEQGAIDHRVLDARVERRHQVERLDDIGTVVTGERDIGLERELARQSLDSLAQRRIDLGRIAARLQQREH
jgi:hypothetical protein